MPLPSRTMPSTLPEWLIDGYQAEPEPTVAHVPMTSGPGRLRPIYTAADRRERGTLRLLPAQLPVWFDFTENTLQSGLLPFAARVCNLGPGVRWFEALLLQWDTDPKPNGRTIVTAELLLRGPAYLSGPAA